MPRIGKHLHLVAKRLLMPIGTWNGRREISKSCSIFHYVSYVGARLSNVGI
jgi:hypothetical protein